MSKDVKIVCLHCGNIDPNHLKDTTCSNCGSDWREAKYNYQEIGEHLLQKIMQRPNDIWRFFELLPVQEPNPSITMFEGGTPLIHANSLGKMLRLPNLYIKDERQNPTGSFKDRQAAITVTNLIESGIDEVVLASTGNVAISYSAYTSRAGIRLWAFLTSMVPVEKIREIAIYGTRVIKVTASYDQTKRVASEFASQRKRGVYLDRGARSIPALEGMKTIAFEISEQLTQLKGSYSSTKKPPWLVPDWYIQSVSGGMGPLGVLKGFLELKNMGIVNHIPSVAAIQVEGCSPMVHAWKNKLETPIPVQSPHTYITTLATGDPGYTYNLLKTRMREGGGGTFESVTDEEAFKAIHILAKMEGLSMEPASAVAFAGLFNLVRSGKINSNDTIVVNLTGHTLPIEKMILGDGWLKRMNIPPINTQDIPEEGLLSALDRISPDQLGKVIIVDDNPDSRQLIRRILETQGEYTIFEATNGKQALDLALVENPDIMIVDLMMPVMDGFGLIDSLKTDERTASVSLIVVTAKELSKTERKLLNGRIHALMQKGEIS